MEHCKKSYYLVTCCRCNKIIINSPEIHGVFPYTTLIQVNQFIIGHINRTVKATLTAVNRFQVQKETMYAMIINPGDVTLKAIFSKPKSHFMKFVFSFFFCRYNKISN